MGLSIGYHNDEDFIDALYLDTPIFKEIETSDLDDIQIYTHEAGGDNVIFLKGEWTRDLLVIARSYKYAGDVLVWQTLSDNELDLGYPILFNYRHSLELYL